MGICPKSMQSSPAARMAMLVAIHARERRLQPDLDDIGGHAFTQDARSQAEHVRVVVGPGHPRRVEAIAQRSSDATNLVCGQLFTLA